ncbi:MAG: DUF4011 domain-containing protein [Alphaproteobacteria bacterium]|nr:DUF4011 domain-containing protein [Alphaproteobacteria bacterium]
MVEDVIAQEPQPELRLLGDYYAGNPPFLPTEDVIHAMLPLMRQVAALHQRGRVARLGLRDVTQTPDGRLVLRDEAGMEPVSNRTEINRVQPQPRSALKVVGEYRVTVDEGSGREIEDLRSAGDNGTTITRPLYLPDLHSWEIELGHHDEITDVYVVGMILASLACGFDPRDPDSIESFSLHHSNLFVLQPGLHPVLASIIVDATALIRHDRATNVASLATRLETYRDQPADLDVERILTSVTEGKNRRTAVLSHLRDRLFDLSRRNRLIYFRTTQGSVNMTEASIPIVMRIESVRADQLCTWRGQFIADVLSGKAIALNKWLRFEDQPHLPSALDKILQDARRDRAEYGFNQLRLIIGFLRWHNLKEAPEQRIVSPLLWLPVELTKAKGVRDQYVMRCTDPIAELNPALRHTLRQLYDIQLPEHVDLTTTTIGDVHAELARQIRTSEPGVRLELQDRPQIRLILQKAVQRVNAFRRRRGQTRQTATSRVDFSYARDDYRPLGHALFEKLVKPSPLPQRMAAGGSLAPSASHIAAPNEAMTIHVGGDAGHRFSWEIDLTQVTLANLNYRKMSLVRDFAELIDKSGDLNAFDGIFSIEPRPFVQEAPPPIPQADKWNVVASDTTQDAAIALARSGRSFVIQGPPGTGKSQTITNLIADYAARGKRVLFVCEKRAALDVVFHRLAQSGLDGLACIIHDSQEDKKEFILDLKKHYEHWGHTEDALERQRGIRSTSVAALEAQISAIAAYDAVVGRSESGTNALNIRDLVRRAAALPPVADHIAIRQRELLPSLSTWDANRSLAQQTMRALSDCSKAPSLAEHPFSRINSAVLVSETPYAALEAIIDEAEEHLARLDHALQANSLITPETGITDALVVLAMAEEMCATGLSRFLDVLNPGSRASKTLDLDLAELKALNNKCHKAAERAIHWSADALSPADTRAALALARVKEHSFFRFFDGNWRRLSRLVRERYDFSAHNIVPTITSVLEVLDKRHEADAAREAKVGTIEQRMAIPSLEAFNALRKQLRGQPPRAVVRMMKEVRASRDGAAALSQAAEQAPTLRRLSQTIRDGIDADQLTLEQLGTLLRDLRESLEDLPDLLPFLAKIHRAEPRFSATLRSIALPLPALEALVVDEAIGGIERANPEIKRFDIDRLMGLTRKAETAQTRLRSSNSDVVRAVLQHNFRDHVRLSELSLSMLDDQGRGFKKRYAGGRRELEHEFGKSMRYRSIRELSGGDCGNVVNDLKPIWLMSPLSVSDTLPLQTDLFDVVIFDEASQIPVEEAVPALCRADQVIIVGDEMQLPPTSFFSAALDDEDTEVIAEEDGQQIAISLGAGSLLNQAAQNLPATLLAWHYRSRFESLISFSNAAFYNGQLVTIPDRALPSGDIAAAPSSSRDDDAMAAGVERLLRSPITTHRIKDGVYEQRINVPEARYIAGMVRELLTRDTGLSLGVVAFSEAQQGEISSALERLAADNPTFATALEQEYVREDDGQFNGLFVKNLENVQGDERDIILMSVCYAPGRDGRMAMNFGPINQRGGEKRLNVIFSRARRHMAIISTIGPEAITNTHNDGARALRNFLAFANAQSSGALDHAKTVLTTLSPQAAETFGLEAPDDPVRTALAEELRSRGHTVHEYVGGASFRCDLAIVGQDGSGYALAILLDRSVEPGDVEERFVFRPTVLRSFGWRVLDVPVATWLRAKDQTIARIETELKRSSWDLLDPNPYPDSVPFSPRTPRHGSSPRPAATHAPAAPPPEMPPPLKMNELQMVEGTSPRFWHIGIDGCDVVIEFGRVGARAQRLVKTFDSKERAKAEAEKLTLEKTRKGYKQLR